MRRLVAAIALMAVLAACSGEKKQPPAPPAVAWSKVDVGAEPVALRAYGDQLLIGLRNRGAKVVPGLVLLDQGKQTPIAIKPNPASPYAYEAVWYSIAYDGKQLLALGGASGGAHSNTRWTVWTGSVAGGLIERPQVFWTFGGQDAGDLFSAVITSSGGRALLGSWGGVETGNDATVWLPQGDAKWNRLSSAKTALQSTPSLLVGPGFGTTLGKSVVFVGSQVRLAPNVVAQEAAVWRSADLNQGWTRIVLPDPGNRSQANTATCSKDCVISGYVDGKLAIWRLGADGTAQRLQGVPSIPVGDKDKLPPPIVDGDKIVQIVAQDNKVKVVTGSGGSWTVQESSGPQGLVTDAAVTQDHKVYLIAGTTLWETTLS
ncbi:hypothetical protein [Kribbella sp. NPDC049227]|uniref:hypothetical protein n=1 Tax=Kribbella sp. NPDC049227 TaxID=3364113 RepID=UPI00371F7E27